MDSQRKIGFLVVPMQMRVPRDIRRGRKRQIVEGEIRGGANEKSQVSFLAPAKDKPQMLKRKENLFQPVLWEKRDKSRRE